MKNDWPEYQILRALTHPKLKDVSERALSDIKEQHFVVPVCREAFKRISSLYIKKGKILSWKELLADTSLSEEVIRKLRSREIKRNTLAKHDKSLMLPRNIDEVQSLLKSMYYTSQHAKLIELQNSITQKLSESDLSKSKLDAIVKDVSNKLDIISSLNTNTGNIVKLTKKSVRDILKNFHIRLKNNWFIPTGYSVFDSVNMGIPLDSYFNISGKTGTGKSSLCIDMAIKMKKLGARVCIVPLEMSIEQNLLRIGANLTKIPIVDIVKDLKAYYKPIMKKVDLFLRDSDEDPSCFHFYEPDVDETVVDILNTLRLGQYDIIFIDYIGLTAPLHDNEAKDLGMASRFAKVFATTNKTIVCYLAQLDEDKNRVRYARKLIEDASNAWFWKQTKEEVAELGYIQVLQKKARNQDPFSFKLSADLSCCRFGNYRDDGSDTPTDISNKKNKRNGKSDRKLTEKMDDKIDDLSADVPSENDV